MKRVWSSTVAAYRRYRAATGGRRAFRLLSYVFVSPVIIYILLLSFPQVLFAHETSYGNFTVYSREPLDQNLYPVLDKVQSRLATSEINDPQVRSRIFLTNSFGFYSWLSLRLGGNSFGKGFAALPNSNLFINKSDSARDLVFRELKIGSAKIPVKLFSAVMDKGVHFHILEDKHLTRVKQHMVNPNTDEEVPTKEVQKGYEIEPGKFVLLKEEELEALEPKPSREIEIAEFVPPDAVSQQWYERPYYLAPDGDVKSYFALAEALNNREREGIARWVMRKKA